MTDAPALNEVVRRFAGRFTDLRDRPSHTGSAHDPPLHHRRTPVDAATLAAVGTIVVGIAAAAGALVGKRGENRAAHSGAVLGGYSTLVDNLQEERNTLQAKLVENDRLLAAAYAELASERADKAALQTRIAELTAENAQLRERIVELGGQPT